MNIWKMIYCRKIIEKEMKKMNDCTICCRAHFTNYVASELLESIKSFVSKGFSIGKFQII